MANLEWTSLKEKKPQENGWYLIYYYQKSKGNPRDGSCVDMCYWNGEKFERSAMTRSKPKQGFSHYFKVPNIPDENGKDENNNWIPATEDPKHLVGWYLLYYPEIREYVEEFKNLGWYIGLCYWNGAYFEIADGKYRPSRQLEGFSHYTPVPSTVKLDFEKI